MTGELGLGSWWARDAGDLGQFFIGRHWIENAGDGFVVVAAPTFDPDDIVEAILVDDDAPMPDQIDTTIDPWTRMLGDCRGYPTSVHQTHDEAQRAADAFASLRADDVTVGTGHLVDETRRRVAAEPDLEDAASLGSRPARARRRATREARR